MKHQFPKVKIFHEPTTILDNSLPKCTEIKPDINILTAETKLWNDTKNGFARCTAAEIQRFAVNAKPFKSVKNACEKNNILERTIMFFSEANLDKHKVNSAHKVIIALGCYFVIRELINLLFLCDLS